jgi:dipeptidyl aminopeptidase/acylaminoacyl peptidase
VDLAIVFLLVPPALCGQLQQRFTVRHSIEMVTFSRDSYSGKSGSIKFSPDGRYFIAVTRRGLLESNQLESTVWLFDSAAVKAFIENPSSIPSPTPLVRMAASSNGEPITEVRWSNGQSIAFLGRDKNSERHLFVVSVMDGKLQQLSPNGQDVTRFDQVKGTFVWTAAPPVTDSELYQSGGPTLHDIQIGTGLSLFNLLYPNWEKLHSGIQPQQIWKARNGNASSVVKTAMGTPVSVVGGSFLSPLVFSPSGRYAIVTRYVDRVPRAWESYVPAFVSSFTRFVADNTDASPTINSMRPEQYALLDLQSGEISSLVDAPLGTRAGYYDATKAAWSQDEHHVALLNTFLPRDGNSAGGHPRASRPCVAVVEVATRSVECVKENRPVGLSKVSGTSLLADIEWRMADQLVLRYVGQDGEEDPVPELLQRQNGVWKQVNELEAGKALEGALSNGGLSIVVRQSLDEAPVLVASDAEIGKTRKVWDPNPQLARIPLGQASVYHWRDKAGHEWTGGLVKPPDYVAGRKYPLVIQTHGFNPNEFLTDGIYTTANAARPLASRGIIVLQVAEISVAAYTPQEAERDGRAGYESAIEQLAADGLVDSQRVGIIGFSRTGWYALDSLIHAPKYFVAATLAESTYESLGEYLVNADYVGPARAKGVAEGIGTEPFGEGLKKWLAESPGFNTEKIHAAVLFEENDPVALIYCWDIYAALRLQEKPVELLYIRNGNHILMKPLDRLASQELNVDWYDFWLNGHEDPDQAKGEQYERWRELRQRYQKDRRR